MKRYAVIMGYSFEEYDIENGNAGFAYFFVDDLKELENDKYTIIPYKDYNEFATKFKDAALAEKMDAYLINNIIEACVDISRIIYPSDRFFSVITYNVSESFKELMFETKANEFKIIVDRKANLVEIRGEGVLRDPVVVKEYDIVDAVDEFLFEYRKENVKQFMISLKKMYKDKYGEDLKMSVVGNKLLISIGKDTFEFDDTRLDIVYNFIMSRK
ncbi:hypothetical protein [Caldicellulosiruptor naganoensis]|uniref:Uncharacterized protein n=1 Tax=Caldicellulosiruptor naganoensis TaxID=29324 RepID=A0ABY7BID5_9FIRM|nr:hypothetical protein [Caldicellulosiruptor naganoensis]WAM32590.1 hypothetical protein OTJ99_001168 [Caldicellulosiruptor naganoensis]